MDALWMAAAPSPCSSGGGGLTVLPSSSSAASDEDAAAELRRGPWAAEEDAVLASHVAAHGEGRWNELARAAGLRRTGKSCRLRWLNYLRPGVRRGGFSPREQLLILDLHARWGNRWSRIAACLPGRTDNEVKNYWRTRVQKHARQLGCDVGSGRFHDAMRHLWMPRLIERIHAEDSAAAAAAAAAAVSPRNQQQQQQCSSSTASPPAAAYQDACAPSPDASCVTGSSSSSREASPAPRFHESSCSRPTTMLAAAQQCQYGSSTSAADDMFDESWSELLARANHDDADSAGLPDLGFGETADNWWGSLEDIWQQPLY